MFEMHNYSFCLSYLILSFKSKKLRTHVVLSSYSTASGLACGITNKTFKQGLDETKLKRGYGLARRLEHQKSGKDTTKNAK